MESKKMRIDISHWGRKEEYLFFNTFFNPMLSVTVEVDCTLAYRKAQEIQAPVSFYCMHAALVAANRIKEFRYRQEGEEVVLYDRIDLVTPIQTGQGGYRSVRLQAENDWDTFFTQARPRIEAAKRGEGKVHAETEQGRNIVVISIIPWYRFTSIQQAIPQEPRENIPIFTFGKLEEHGGKRTMPVALSVHHGFVSGYEIGRYLEEFQRLLNGERGG